MTPCISDWYEWYLASHHVSKRVRRSLPTGECFGCFAVDCLILLAEPPPLESSGSESECQATHSDTMAHSVRRTLIGWIDVGTSLGMTVSLAIHLYSELRTDVR